MPAAYAHIFYGNTVYHHLPRLLQRRLLPERDLFEIGLQGPDILFYYHPLKKNAVSALGSRMHESSGRTWFSQAVQVLDAGKEQPDGGRQWEDAATAYVYGVLCHFVLDSHCHDYINAFVTQSGITHYEIEGEFDRSLMVLKQKDPVSENPIPGFHASRRAAGVIAPFYPGLGENTVMAALQSFVRFHELLRCPTDFKREALYRGLKAIGQYENLHGHIINKEANPACEESNEELLRRLRAAVPEAIRLIEGFNLEEVLQDPAFGLNFEGVRLQTSTG